MNHLIVTGVLSTVLCGLYLRFARHWQILDQPNERSSHVLPTPHGGGVPLMLAFALGVWLSAPWPREYLFFLAGGLFLMLLGVLDDVRGLRASLRFGLYGLAAVCGAALVLDGALPLLSIAGLGWLLAYAFAILWALNLYNFMDGIDGIAATQCIVACLGAAMLANSGMGQGSFALFCLLLAAAQLGFLCWNWAPARLFMGDAGSVATGFLLAILAGFGAVSGEVPFACWAILLAVFITDASWTLAWRLFTGQPFTQAHRLHAYQRLSRRWNSHRKVVWLLLAINILWLWPLAWAAVEWPLFQFYFVILAYIPLALGMVKTGKFT